MRWCAGFAFRRRRGDCRHGDCISREHQSGSVYSNLIQFDRNRNFFRILPADTPGPDPASRTGGDTVIDGELVIERNEEDNEAMVSAEHGLVREAQAEQATFYAFDCLGIKGQNCMQAPFHIRYKVSTVISPPLLLKSRDSGM